MRRSLSLRAKTVAFTVALAFGPLLLLATALLAISYDAKLSDVLEQQRAMATQLASRVSSTLSEMQRALDMVGWTSNWEALDGSSRVLLIDNLYKYRMLASVQGGFGEFDGVALFDGDAQPVAGHTTIRMEPLAALADEVRATAFDVVMRGDAYRGPVYISQATFPPLDVAVPARDLPGRITGVLWHRVPPALEENRRREHESHDGGSLGRYPSPPEHVINQNERYRCRHGKFCVRNPQENGGYQSHHQRHEYECEEPDEPHVQSGRGEHMS